MAAHVLAPVASLVQTCSTTVVHPTWFPFPLVPCFHAARISLAFRGRQKATGNDGKLSWAQEIAGFLVMAWGGSFISHYLLHLTPPQLLSFGPVYNYVGVYLFLRLLFALMPTPPAYLVDTAAPLFDAIARSAPIVGGVHLVTSHANPAVRSSLLLQLLLGAIGSAGGGMSAATLQVWTTGWTLHTPVFLVNPSPLATLDVWAGAAGAGLYGFLTASHPAYEPLALLATNGTSKALLSAVGARAAVVVFLTLCFGTRAVWTHWCAPVSPPAKAKAGSAKTKEDALKKAQ